MKFKAKVLNRKAKHMLLCSCRSLTDIDDDSHSTVDLAFNMIRTCSLLIAKSRKEQQQY